MQRNPEPAAPGNPPLPRPLTLFQILAIVLLWNCGYKGTRVANTLFALESSATLALGGYTGRARRVT